jgi:FixJ family two-component response regulator
MVIETGATIFVVDDDEFVRDSLKTLIKAAGFSVEAFGSAEEFLVHAAHKSSGLLVLDVRMPGMSGLELQKRLASASWIIPIIFITAHEDKQAYNAAMEKGAVAFLRKPFDDQELFDAIHLAFEQLTEGPRD